MEQFTHVDDLPRALELTTKATAAAAAGVPTFPADRPHQGLILDASPLVWRSMEQLTHVDDLPRAVEPITIPLAGATEHSDEAGASSSSSSSDSSTGGSCIQHPVWLALDEVMDPVSGTAACCVVHRKE